MPATSQIETPSLENLPMIDRSFSTAINHHHGDECILDSWPDVVGCDLIDAFDALNPVIATALLDALQPTVRGKLIREPKDLSTFTQANREQFLEESEEEELGHFSDKHLQMYLLQRAIYPNHIDWRKVVDVINAASDEQKWAIEQFFLDFYILEIDRLLATTSMALAVPASLYSKNEVCQDGGECFVHCNVANTWMRDLEFYRQFEVSARDLLTSELGIVGYAGTLEQAIAKASLFAMSKSNPVAHQADPFGDLNTAGGRPFTLTLRRRKSLIAVASIVNLNTEIPCMLHWDVVRNGAIDETVVRRALYAAEASLHVQWSKARDLEAALGL